LFEKHCVGCHGADASGDVERMIPALAGQRRAYVIKQLADFTEHERYATEMHRVVKREEIHDPQSWADLAQYINTMSIKGRKQMGDGVNLSLGEASYRQNCETCHGADGRGDDDGFVPSVRNQHYAYLLGETRALATGHRFNIEPDLMRFLNSLDADEMRGLADYMSRMRGPVRDRSRLDPSGSAGD
jgi:cytochrome c553